jgi:hypothetical protein
MALRKSTGPVNILCKHHSTGQLRWPVWPRSDHTSARDLMDRAHPYEVVVLVGAAFGVGSHVVFNPLGATRPLYGAVPLPSSTRMT